MQQRVEDAVNKEIRISNYSQSQSIVDGEEHFYSSEAPEVGPPNSKRRCSCSNVLMISCVSSNANKFLNWVFYFLFSSLPLNVYSQKVVPKGRGGQYEN